MAAAVAFSWPRWRRCARCSARSCVGSIGSNPSRSRHELGCGEDTETRLHSAQTPVAKRERRFGARSALLPMRSGLPAALEGRTLDCQRPASGKCRIKESMCRDPPAQNGAALSLVLQRPLLRHHLSNPGVEGRARFWTGAISGAWGNSRPHLSEERAFWCTKSCPRRKGLARATARPKRSTRPPGRRHHQIMMRPPHSN
jgi:hypothetical protein